MSRPKSSKRRPPEVSPPSTTRPAPREGLSTGAGCPLSFSCASPSSDAAQRWRTVLLGTVAASALLFGYGRTARAGPDACVTAGNTATCQGNQSNGIASGADFNPAVVDTLNVNSLTTDIAPAAGVNGILFFSSGDITIVSNTGPYAISVTGGVASGIYVNSSGNGVVTIDSTGDITSTAGQGIFVNNSGSGAVSVTSVGTIEAEENGILALSYGGSGAVSIDSTGDITTGNRSGLVAVNYGPGAVSVTSVGTIEANTFGIYALSNTGAVTVDSTGDITATNRIGIYALNNIAGAGDVLVTSAGTIEAGGDGIYAFSVTGAVTVDSTGDITSTNDRGIAALNVGSASVKVESTGTIEASDIGIYAHSIGDGTVEVVSTGNLTSHNNRGIHAGNNGTGDVSATSVGSIEADLEGIWAQSADGAVTVDSTGDITSANNRGIFARNFDAAAVSVTSDGAVQALSDGIYATSNTGTVTVDSTGDITSANNRGIIAFNYGAGAGDVSVTSVGAIEANTDGIFARSNTGGVEVDSTGDITSATRSGIYAANNGADAVSVTSAGAITANTDGIFARSISGTVTVDSTGDVTSANDQGIYAGNTGAAAVSVESDGTIQAFTNGIIARSNTGAVTVDSTGDIASANARGIFAFNYGLNAGDVSVTSVGAIEATTDGIFARSNTGAVTVDSTGDITSQNGVGIYAGNNSPDAVLVTSAGNIDAFAGGIVVRSITGALTVDSTGDISSANARGIYARNTGLGGTSVTSVGRIAGGTDGILAYSYLGNVTVDSTGDIVANAGHGIYARKGGVGAGNLSVTSAGTIEANSVGIYVRALSGRVTVESTGGVTSATNDAIRINTGTGSTVTLRGGTVFGASDGVEFEGDGTNTLHNFADLSGGALALRGDIGDEIVHNHGVITGNIDLGGDDNAFFNEAAGTFRSGTSVILGAGNTLTNAGILAPFGTGTIGTTAVTGNVVQTAGGTFAVDLDLGGATADRVDVTGTAALAGTVVVNVTSLSTLAQQHTILSAAGGTTDNGLGLLASPALNATLTYPNANDVVLGITLDFSPDGLNRNQTKIATHLDGAFGAGGGGLTDVLLALLNLQSLDAYKDALDQLSPEIYNATTIAALYASLDFSNALLSCKTNGGDTAAIVREGQCLWAGARARFLDSESTRENIGFDETAGLFSAGAQVAIDPSWRLGFGVSYQTSTLQTDTGAESEGDLVLGGLALKYNTGPLLLAATASGGRGWYDTTRPIAFGGFAATAEGSHEIDVLAGGLHASYVLGSTALYAKPLIDVNVTHLDLGNVRETGAGGAGLLVDGGEETVVTVAPALEIGTQWQWANGTLVRPYIRAGATWFSDDEIALDASFLGSPAGIAPFRIVNELDEVRADFGVGLDLVNDADAALRLGYDGHVGETTESHSFAIKGSARF